MPAKWRACLGQDEQVTIVRQRSPKDLAIRARLGARDALDLSEVGLVVVGPHVETNGCFYSANGIHKQLQRGQIVHAADIPITQQNTTRRGPMEQVIRQSAHRPPTPVGDADDARRGRRDLDRRRADGEFVEILGGNWMGGQINRGGEPPEHFGLLRLQIACDQRVVAGERGAELLEWRALGELGEEVPKLAATSVVRSSRGTPFVRADLVVPYVEKDVAKQLGACWDPDRRLWYAPTAGVAAACKRWIKGAQPGL